MQALVFAGSHGSSVDSVQNIRTKFLLKGLLTGQDREFMKRSL